MMQSFIENYKAGHRHPINRLTHYIGIPAIVVSLVAIFFNFKLGLALFVIGWALQFIGHFVEGNRPAFFKNPIYLLVGPLWLMKRLRALAMNNRKFTDR